MKRFLEVHIRKFVVPQELEQIVEKGKDASLEDADKDWKNSVCNLQVHQRLLQPIRLPMANANDLSTSSG